MLLKERPIPFREYPAKFLPMSETSPVGVGLSLHGRQCASWPYPGLVMNERNELFSDAGTERRTPVVRQVFASHLLARIIVGSRFMNNSDQSITRGRYMKARFSRCLPIIAWCLASGLLLPPALHDLRAQVDPEATIAAIQRRYARVDVIQADFRQTFRAPGMDQTESGVVYLKKPGLMRWEYQKPESKLFVADGRETWLYTPQDRQVLVRRFTVEDLRSTPLQILVGGGDMLRSYAVSRETGTAIGGSSTITLRLTPRRGETEFTHILIECSSVDYEMRRILIAERTGNTSEFVFSNIRINGKIDIKQFKFKIPKGVEVVRVDEK